MLVDLVFCSVLFWFCSGGAESGLASVGGLHLESVVCQGLYLFGNSRNRILES